MLRPGSASPRSARYSAASAGSSSERSASTLAQIGYRLHAVDLGQVRADLALVDVGDVEHRLHREQVKVAQHRALVIGHLHAVGTVTLGQVSDHALREIDLGLDRLVALRFLLEARDGLLGRSEVGEHELELDGLDIRSRIDLAVHVDHVVVGEEPHHLGDGVGLADVGEELVARARRLRSRPSRDPRCRRTPRWRERLAEGARSARASRAARRARALRRRWARSSRRGSWRRRPGCASAP